MGVERTYRYPEELPVVAERARIVELLRRHQVIIVCGDTGSGKTTQLPKMALEAGFGAKGRLVACTQPRRLAAVTVAERVAHELGEEVGASVGYQHRFGRRLSDATRVKFMTDGILLAETRHDPLLRAYDAIIIDEAHERTLNVDFLLGILKRILERRRDLRVIVSSATLDTGRFSAFFDDAPAVIVPGRLFPIETRYLPPPEDGELDLPQQIVRAVDTLPPDYDILVFLSGERDIREAAEALEGAGRGRDDVIPLLASLPAAEQRRAFQGSPRRRIVLATNVAETSLTIPGVRAVIDSGLARISRYLQRTQVQRLQIESVSQASARQRMGRCGRIGPGICVRLYSEEDFLQREEYTPPEILRSSLAGVILTMLDLRLGDISRFPFLEPPRPAAIAAGLRELLELGAIERGEDGGVRLTKNGRRLARFPVEPRLARMLLAGSDFAVLPRVLPIVAAMSGEDPRRRPADEREKAQQAHAKFKAEGSDFLGTLRLWQWWREQSDALSQSKLRRLCKDSYLSFPKMREWGDTVRQLTGLAERSGLDLKNDTGDEASLHRALLTGLVTRVGHFDPETREYRGVRGLRFVPHPSSVLKKRPPEWIVAGELVDTARLFAANAAAIDVDWIESAAQGVVKSHYHSPEWDPRSGFVRATEQVTLYGLVIVPARRCDYSRIDPVVTREIFLRRGIIDGALPRPPPLVRHNNDVLDELRRHAERLRDPSLFDEEALYRYFEECVPADVLSAPALFRWLRTATPAETAAFRLNRDDWIRENRDLDARFPRSLKIGSIRLDLDYRHSPDDPEHDGLTCSVRRRDAGALRLWRSDWLVPGMLPEKLSWMLSVLPTAQRKVLTPIADSVAGLLAKLRPGAGPLDEEVVKTVYAEWGFRISPEAWTRVKIPEHLKVRFRILADEGGKTLACGRDLEAVLTAAGVGGGTVNYDAGKGGGQVCTDWSFGELPEKTSALGKAGDWRLEHYPALHDEGTGVTVRLHVDAAVAAREHDAGVLRLYLLQIGDRLRSGLRVRQLPLDAQLYLKGMDYDPDRLRGDIAAGAVRAVLVDGQPSVRTAEEFARRLEANKAELVSVHAEIERLTVEILAAAGGLQRRLETAEGLPSETVDSVMTQLVWLTLPGFPRTTPLENLRRCRVYFKGASVRLDRARVGRSSDLAREARFDACWRRYRAALAEKGRGRLPPERLAAIRWMLEEFRISLFAQELKTPFPVSEQRLERLYGMDG